MRVLLMHPNYHSGGAEIAGNWPPAWAAYLAGFLRSGGYDDIHFVDAMTHHLDDEAVRARIAEIRPDIVGCTAITPAIYKAERLLQVAKEVNPAVVTVLGGIHGTFMYPQVLKEAPWIDAVVRGEGEMVFLNLVRAVDDGSFARDRSGVRGIAYLDGDSKVVATPAEPPIADLDRIAPDWGILEWDKYIYIPMGRRVAIPNFARGCPFTCSFCSQWKFWRDYRIRDPIKVVDEIETLVRQHDVGFFILADEEPTIHRKKFIAFCEELIRRDLGVLWGINTRVTDILRDEKLLPLFRKAGLIHVSLGTEAAAQLKLERFNKETTIAQNKRAIQLLRDVGIVAEAQFIVGLENETAETLEETYRMAQDWKPDMANWAMYTPWPFSDLFQELGDKVEVFDFEKYNFVTPIMKPDAMERGELLDRVMHNYRRFYMRKSLLEYPWIRDKAKRSYMLGCLKAFLKSGFQRTFYDLGRVGYWGPQTKKTVDFGFDAGRRHERPDPAAIAEADEGWVTMHGPKIEMKRRKGEELAAAAIAQISACGGGKEQLDESLADAAAGAVLTKTAPSSTPARRVAVTTEWPGALATAAMPLKEHAGARPRARPGAIGPNAITRVAEALRVGMGPGAAERVFAAAGLAHHLREPPTALVDEADVVELHRALRADLGDVGAAAVAHDAGAATARYLLAHRIPKPLQAVLRRLPARWAAAMLMTAIARHAWTFAGSGKFSSAAHGRRGWVVAIRGNPLVLSAPPVTRAATLQTPPPAAPACAFYAATFESLFRALVHESTEVQQACCEASGGDACRFAITW